MTNATQQCPACESNAVAHAQTVCGFDIARCDRCGLHFATGKKDRKTADYDEMYKQDGLYAIKLDQGGRAEGHLQRFGRARRIAIREIERFRPRSMLEIGCGVGRFLDYFRDSGTQCYGIDVSANAIKLARQYLACPLHCGVLDGEAFPGVTFDVVCLWEVLEHVDVGEVESFMHNIFNRLNPGGYVFLSTPNYESRWLWSFMPGHPPGRPPVHVTFWTQHSLELFLGRLGFEDVLIRRLSVPANCAMATGSALDRKLVYLDALLRPRQRRTLLARARRPAAAPG